MSLIYHAKESGVTRWVVFRKYIGFCLQNLFINTLELLIFMAVKTKKGEGKGMKGGECQKFLFF